MVPTPWLMQLDQTSRRRISHSPLRPVVHLDEPRTAVALASEATCSACGRLRRSLARPIPTRAGGGACASTCFATAGSSGRPGREAEESVQSSCALLQKEGFANEDPASNDRQAAFSPPGVITIE